MNRPTSRTTDRRALLGAALSTFASAALGCSSDKPQRELVPSAASGSSSGTPSSQRGPGTGGLDPAIREALVSADTFVIYTLNPLPGAASASPKAAASGSAKAATVFHEYAVLGSATLEDAATRERLVAAIDRGIRESDGSIAACFNPRHGVSAKRGERSVDLVICFECLQIEIWDGSARSDALTSSGVEPAVSAIYRESGLTSAR